VRQLVRRFVTSSDSEQFRKLAVAPSKQWRGRCSVSERWDSRVCWPRPRRSWHRRQLSAAGISLTRYWLVATAIRRKLQPGADSRQGIVGRTGLDQPRLRCSGVEYHARPRDRNRRLDRRGNQARHRGRRSAGPRSARGPGHSLTFRSSPTVFADTPMPRSTSTRILSGTPPRAMRSAAVLLGLYRIRARTIPIVREKC
jgi:hypothetical protein